MSSKKVSAPSRRAALIAAAKAGVLMAGLRATPSAAQTGRPATAFALLGDRFHSSDLYRTAMRKTFVRDMGLAIDFSDEVTLLNPDHLSRYKLLILYRNATNYEDDSDPGANLCWWRQGKPKIVSVPPLPETKSRTVVWVTPEMGRAVRQFVERGGGALLYHNATFLSRHNADFLDVAGAVTRDHAPIRPYKVKILKRNHPITRDVNDFVVTDEQHYQDYRKDPKNLLLECVNEDGLTHREFGTSSPAGWAYDYGKGRVCFLSPGHLVTALWNPEYEKIQRNAARWLLKEL